MSHLLIEFLDHKNPNKFYEVDNDVITVKFKGNFNDSFDRLKEKYNVKLIRKASTGYIDIEIPQGQDIVHFAEILQQIDYIENVDINSFGEFAIVPIINDFTPNDTDYDEQWYLNKIEMPKVWNLVKGNSCIVVAILDAGTDWLHEDLGNGSDSYNNIWHNTGENDWSNSLNPASGNENDDDGNEFEDDWIGWDFANDDNDTRNLTNRHGTLVAGIVSAKTNNGKGVAGIAGGNNNQGILIMPVQVGNDIPIGSIVDDAILYAVQNGADVINMSFGGISQTNAIDAAIQVAENANVTLVAAAGNSNSSVEYPANNEDVIAVGSSTESDYKAPLSNYGSDLFIAAPGENIYNTVLSDNYDDGSGNSFAAPQVSAVVALLKQVSPLLNNQQVKDILKNSADKVGGYYYDSEGKSLKLGYGRLNAFSAIQEVFPYISGASIVCASNKIFTINNIPDGDAVIWTRSSNLSYVSGQGTTSFTVKASSSTVSGSGWIQATISNDICNSFTIRKDIWVGKAGQPTISPSGYPTIELQPGQYITIRATKTPGNPTSFNWWVTGNPCGVDIYSGTNSTSCTFEAMEPSWNNFYFNTTNVCGTSASAGGAIEVLDGGGGGMMKMLTVSPNPANDYIEAYIENLTEEERLDNEKLHIKIVNSNSIPVYNGTTQQKKFQINTSSLPEGVYYLLVQYKNQKYSTSILISR